MQKRGETKEKDVVDSFEDYLRQADWKIKENANIPFSFSGAFFRAAGEVVTRFMLKRVYPQRISKAHVNGDLHIHNLYMGLCLYCGGWDLRKILLEGLGGVPFRLTSAPPKHLRTAVHQMVNFAGIIQNEFAGAIAFNSVDTFLAPFVRKDRLNYKEIKQCIQEFVFGVNVTARWGGQCISEDTEILTKEGWKTYKDVKEGEEILTFNLAKKKLEYTPVLKIHVYPYDGFLLNIKSRVQDQLVTPNHKVLRKRFNSNDYQLVQAKDLFKFKSGVIIPLAAQWDGIKVISDEEVRLIAWLVSKGSFLKNERISVGQSLTHSDHCNEIRSIFTNLEFNWTETLKFGEWSKFPCAQFKLKKSILRWIRNNLVDRKDIPPAVLNSPSKQLKLFLKTCMKGSSPNRIQTKSKKIADRIQEIAVKAGYGSSLRQEKRIYTIRIHPFNQSCCHIKLVPYRGTVWCVTTKNGTIVCRRKGKVFITGNSPFTNITLDWVIPKHLAKERAVLSGKIIEDTYAEYQAEADLINRAFCEVMLEGNGAGKVFTFPLITINLTKYFDWESENANLLFELAGRFGVPYFQNFIKSDLDPKEIHSMCCRLRIDVSQLYRRYGYFGFGNQTGSIGVVTINLPRIGYLARDELDFFERLSNSMELAKESLEIKRRIVQENMERGLLPFTKRYLGTLMWHFSTIGLVGMNEACLNLLGESIATKEGQKFAIKVLKFMREKVLEYQEETGNIYNIEATPAEGCQTADSIIITEKGFQKISELNSCILNEKGKLERIKKHYSRKYRGEVIEIQPRYLNLKAVFTPEHPILAIKTIIRNKGRSIKVNCGYDTYNETMVKHLRLLPRFIPAAELREKDVLLLPRFSETVDADFLNVSQIIEKLKSTLHPNNPIQAELDYAYYLRHPENKTPTKLPLTKEILWLYGLYISKGSTTRSQIRFSLAMNEVNIAKRIIQLMKKYFKLEGKISKKERKLIVKFHSTLLGHIFKVLFGKSARKKKIPYQLLLLSIDKLKELFLGIHEGDGYKGDGWGFNLTTTSPTLAGNLLLLLSKIGVIPRISFSAKRRAFNIRVYGKKEILRFKAKRRNRFYNYEWVDENYIYLPIRKVTKKKYVGNVYNFETSSGTYCGPFLVHNCSYRLARIDKEKYPKIITAGKEVPYYTNSTWLPVDYTDDLWFVLNHQEPLQTLYTGGTVVHIFLGEKIDANAAKILVKKIATKFSIPYFTITPTFSICSNHGYLPGEHWKCPTCGKDAEVYSRVVGYLRPVQAWNPGKQEEFRQRKVYKLEV